MRFRMLFGALLSSAVVAGCSDVKESPLGPCEERMPTAETIEIEVARGSIAFVDMLDGASANGCGTLEVVANSWSDGEKGEVRRSEDNPNELAYLSDREAIGDDTFSFIITNGYNELEVPVNVRIYQRLKLTGTFPHGWVESPDITVEGEDIGGTGEVTANGVYEVNLRLFSLEGDTVNLLSVEGQRHGSPFSLHSMLPSTERLYAMRAGDDRVSESAWPALRVNSITTAYAMLLHGASGDILSFSDAKLAQYGRAVDSNRLADISAWVYLVADEADYSLPEGYSTSWTLAADRDVLDAELSTAREADALSRAMQSIVLNSAFMPEPSTDHVQGRFSELGSQVPWWPQSESRSWYIDASRVFWLDGDQQIRASDYRLNGATFEITDSMAPFQQLEILVADETQLVLWHEGEAFRLERNSYSYSTELSFNLEQPWVLPALPLADQTFTSAEVVYSFSGGTFTTSHAGLLGAEYMSSGTFELSEDGRLLTLQHESGAAYRIRRVNQEGVGSVIVENTSSAGILVGSGFDIASGSSTPNATGSALASLKHFRAINNWHRAGFLGEVEQSIRLQSNGSGLYVDGPDSLALTWELTDEAGLQDVVVLTAEEENSIDLAPRQVFWKIIGENTDNSLRVLEWTYAQQEDGSFELEQLPHVTIRCRSIEACTSAWW